MAITLEGRETIRIGDQQKFVPRLILWFFLQTGIHIYRVVGVWSLSIMCCWLKCAGGPLPSFSFQSFTSQFFRKSCCEQRKQFEPEVSMQKFPISEISLDSLQILHSSKGISGILGLQHMMKLGSADLDGFCSHIPWNPKNKHWTFANTDANETMGNRELNTSHHKEQVVGTVVLLSAQRQGSSSFLWLLPWQRGWWHLGTQGMKGDKEEMGTSFGRGNGQGSLPAATTCGDYP